MILCSETELEGRSCEVLEGPWDAGFPDRHGCYCINPSSLAAHTTEDVTPNCAKRRTALFHRSELILIILCYVLKEGGEWTCPSSSLSPSLPVTSRMLIL